LGTLPGISFMPEAAYGTSTRWLTVILIDPEDFGADREAVRVALASENIESRPVWKPMHLQPVFRAGVSAPSHSVDGRHRPHPCRIVGGAVSEDLFDRGLCLPSGTALQAPDLQRIIDVITRVHRNGE
jgi:dTDP-4-amino-4,6-dideoxygalactose transaminase